MESDGLVPCLQQAIQEVWSGTVQVSEKGQTLGQVVFSEGKVAWATCRGHPETLGVFLWRLGRLTHGELGSLRIAYQQHQGQKKLGALAEEMGMVSRPVLRRCLMLHTRSAITALLSHSEAQATPAPGSPQTDENLLFHPEEVLPPGLWDHEKSVEAAHSTESAVRRWRMRTSENAILERLIALPGHMASAIFSSEGAVVTGFCTHPSVDLLDLGVFLAEAMEAASRVKAGTPLQSIHGMADKGTWAARWIDTSRNFFVGVLLEEEGDPTLANQVLLSAVPTMLTWLARGGLVPEGERPPPEKQQGPAADESLPAAAEGGGTIIGYSLDPQLVLAAAAAASATAGRIVHTEEPLAVTRHEGDAAYLPHMDEKHIRSAPLSIDSYRMELKYRRGYTTTKEKRRVRRNTILWVGVILAGSVAVWALAVMLFRMLRG